VVAELPCDPADADARVADRRLPACVPSHRPDDQDGEGHVEDQQRLHQRQALEAERDDLQDESRDVRGDGDQLQRLPDQV
jgi:hypothetical protein